VSLSQTHVLTLSCPDRPGIVHAVAGAIVEADGTITSSQQFEDPGTGQFFMRVAMAPAGPAAVAPDLGPDPQARFGSRVLERLTRVTEQFGMRCQLHPASRPTRALIMVSLGGHCLNDLLFRARSGALPVHVPAVVGNHEALRGLAEFYSVPFHHVPVGKDAASKRAAEARLGELVAELDVELVVLARYMQVLSDTLCASMPGRVINIHHSFLPSFKGAKPYHAAHDRGVKLVGATAHYVTPDLDEGPIIEQDVLRVDHSMGADDLAAAGRDVESQVLARAVRWHAEHRVLLNGTRTIVFR
jgi:formyltetrahydrofolate deformylase